MPAFATSQRLKCTVDSLVKIGLDMELLFVNNLRLFAIVFILLRGVLPALASELLDLHTRVI